MQRALCVALVMIAGFASSIPASADVTTVVLAHDLAKKTFDVTADDKEAPATLLEFELGPPPTPDAKVKECSLRVVPIAAASSPRRADQDVSVSFVSSAGRAGGWSAYGNTLKPYVVPLQPQACAENLREGLVSVALKTESLYTAWSYHGGGASVAADRPRLIVTYDSPDPVRSTESTVWKYADPESFYSVAWAELPSSETLLSNPVSQANGQAMWVVAGSSSARRLYVVTRRGEYSWPLGTEVTAGSFAFMTSRGQLKLITKDAALSCETDWHFNPVGSGKEVPCTKTSFSGGLTVNEKETPTMGGDGSLYFRNVQAGGAIVALNPALQEIWTTQLKMTTVSPIALSANGRFAYVLADISIGATRRNLLRIDTATGETTSLEFEHCPSGSPPCEKPEQPALQTLLRPAVITRIVSGEAVDYVFAAGNTNEKGYLQLVEFRAGEPHLLWSQQLAKTLSTAPLPSADGNAVYVAAGDTISRYVMPAAAGGVSVPGQRVVADSTQIEANVSVHALLVDGVGSMYASTDNGLYIYQGSGKKWFGPQAFPSATSLQFTADGTLIGYAAHTFYDMSPKAQSPLSVGAIETQTIYSADKVIIRPDAVWNKPINSMVQGIDMITRGFSWPDDPDLKLNFRSMKK